MRMISQEVIDKVLDTADIVEVIGESLTLKKAGKGYVACCPFHKEKTPSFSVSPSLQTWHCFGACNEGGNVISYVMKKEGYTYPEAVRALAKKYSIEIEEEQEDAEAYTRRMKREALLALNERVAKFYVSKIKELDGAAAWNYALKRFGQDYTVEYGIGYAPKEWDTLVNWAKAKGENMELLVELGLVKVKEETGRMYDFYRDRLIIPIRTRSRGIIGFTARRMNDDKDDVAKYQNSCESVLYHKSESVFGIDVAWREACKTELFYLVEGAPDAMKMQSVGIPNVVAPLGGHWTKEQLTQLKKVAKELCFINDADPVPHDKPYGTGIEFVMKNGMLAMQLGFSVTVREIPNKEGNLKQDPGDFFINKNKMRDLKVEDFVIWSASKLCKKDDISSKKSENFRYIAELASYITDDMRIEMLLPELNKFYKGKEFWRNAINEAKWQRNKKTEKKNDVDLQQYGFYCEHGCYLGLTDKGDQQWSNFTMKPLFHIKDAEAPRRLFHIKNFRGQEEIVEMNMEDITSVSKFQQKLGGIGNFIWEAGSIQLTKLLKYLYDNTDTAQQIKQMGWHQAGFYVFGNGIWIEGVFHKADEFGVCRTEEKGNWYIPAASKIYKEDKKKFERERKFTHQNLQTIRFGEYMEKFITVYGNNGKIGLCYWVASLFRDIITSHTRSFPLLDLFGPKGSGKTELGAALMAFFVPDNKAPNLRNSTSTALNDDVAFASNAMVHLDEYKNDIRPDKIEFLKGLYDGVGRTKMAGQSYDARIMTSVKSGVIISGQEMPTADIALFHRCIYLSFPRSEFTIDERRRFAELREIQKTGLSSFTLEVLSLRKKMEGMFMETYNDVLNDINEITEYAKLETRIVENWAKAIAAFKVVEGRLNMPFSYRDILEIAKEGILIQNQLSGTGNELAQFWKAVQFLQANGEIFDTADFKIRTFTKFKSNLLDKVFGQPKKVILLNRARILMLYKRACLQMGDSALPEDSLLVYLSNSDYYMGSVKSVRFKRILKNGQKEVTTGADGKLKEVESVTSALAFDYEIICERYGINLDNYEEMIKPSAISENDIIPDKDETRQLELSLK